LFSPIIRNKVHISELKVLAIYEGAEKTTWKRHVMDQPRQ
jgi:hypothetical protein